MTYNIEWDDNCSVEGSNTDYEDKWDFQWGNSLYYEEGDKYGW
jgi:hypothetical protein